MKKLLPIVFIIILILFPSYLALSQKKVEKEEAPYVTINNQKFEVEVPKTLDDFNKGLMFRTEICKDCGMLFIFQEEGTHGFWMKNTLIPLDIIHINSKLEVVDIIHAIPCEKDMCKIYEPKEKSLYVLEVRGNTFNQEVVGSTVEINV
jgi:uncharacterized membrane protein (UPF0127 family)